MAGLPGLSGLISGRPTNPLPSLAQLNQGDLKIDVKTLAAAQLNKDVPTFNLPLIGLTQPDTKTQTISDKQCLPLPDLGIATSSGTPKVYECQKTTSYLTDFEVARILGERAKQIDNGAPRYVQDNPSLDSALKIAAAEILSGVVPFESIRLQPVSAEVVSFSQLKLTEASRKRLLRIISPK